MKEKIIECLNKEYKALDVMTINNLLNLKTVDELNELSSLLEEMQLNGEIFKTNKDKYILFKNCPGVYAGKLHINRKGHGIVILPQEDDIFIPQMNLNGAINDDLVVCEISKSGFRPEGRIIKVLKRDLHNITGIIDFNKKNIPIFIPDDKDTKISIKLDPATTKGCVSGTKVSISVGKEIGKNSYIGSVYKILGHKDDPGMDIISVASNYGIYEDFGDKVESELKKIPTEVRESDLEGRTDLTNKCIFTIDDKSTKDIDDAISLEIVDGKYHLGVHIADVSYYVRQNTAIWDSAFERGTSNYLADKVIPMLAHVLSNGICSLNENVVRLTISCQMVLDEKGYCENTDIVASYIKSNKKMTYQDVNKIIMDNEVPEGYEPFAETLVQMNELAKKLRKKRINQGYLDFDLDEAKIIQDESGEAVDVVLRERGDAEKMIEVFMLEANENVASYFENLDLPFIYRVHDKPSEEKVQEFMSLLKHFGYNLDTKVRDLSPKTMQKILNELRDKHEFKILSGILLRSMRKAVYSRDNIGHYGLASKCYTHFTSPIRRFPDLIVHQLIRTYIFNNDLSMKTINYYNNALVGIAEHSSEREQAAINAERDVDAMKMAEYMSKHIGEEFDAVITNVTGFGFYVQLPNLIEGLVHIKSLDDDYYNYYPESMSLIGDNGKKIYRVGDELKVKVVASSKETGLIDFVLAEEKDGNRKQRS